MTFLRSEITHLLICYVLDKLSQFASIVITVRESLYRVNVIFGRFIVGKKDARMMIELEQSHRALDTVVEGIC